MRTLLLALMIVLLPLRGWLGDAMALDLSGPHHGAASTSAAAPATASPAVADCHGGHDGHMGHAAMSAAADGQASSPHDDDCGSCSLCQICHSVVLASVLPPLPSLQLGVAAPQSRQPQYASVARLPGDKPPKA